MLSHFKSQYSQMFEGTGASLQNLHDSWAKWGKSSFNQDTACLTDSKIGMQTFCPRQHPFLWGYWRFSKNMDGIDQWSFSFY